MAKTSMLLFMPWCRIDKAYQVGEIELLPYERYSPAPIDALDDLAQCRINTILSMYKDIKGRPVDRVAFIRHKKKELISVLTDKEVEVISDLVALACFCALSKRKYFNMLNRYCNSDCFEFYVQKFDRADFTAVTSRRREGSICSGWEINEISITIPTHCSPITNVSLDETLLQALISYRDGQGSNDWHRWQNAISCFNQANTDSSTIRYQMEWVLLCSAFEHLLNTRPNAKDVASKFVDAMTPAAVLLAKDATRGCDHWRDNNKSLRYEWMREFYRIRGDFAHGRLNTQRPAAWNPLEHLVLGTIAFPFVIKSILQGNGLYELSDRDRAQMDAFDQFADTPGFLRPPADQKHSFDTYWNRLTSEREYEIGIRSAMERVWNVPLKRSDLLVTRDSSEVTNNDT